MSIPAFPLQWPETFPRAKTREKGSFKTALSGALKNVDHSLQLFAADSRRPMSGIVLTSNYSLGVTKPADPGVAVWFLWDGEQRCIPVDRYSSIEGNLQAIHHIIEARRVELRHGTLELVRASFKGFTLALPAPGKRPWREVLGIMGGVAVTHDMIAAFYREEAARRHPDKPGGSHDAMTELNQARAEALKEIGDA